jgi:hypothetical protein
LCTSTNPTDSSFAVVIPSNTVANQEDKIYKLLKPSEVGWCTCPSKGISKADRVFLYIDLEHSPVLYVWLIGRDIDNGYLLRADLFAQLSKLW